MRIAAGLRAALREPLVHFLLAGAAIFAVFGRAAPDAGERRIVIDAPFVARQVERWTQTYHRPPTPAELDGLIRDAVKDQVYYREAQRLGLDRDDEVVIRRMRTKLEALGGAEAEAAQPGDADLQAMIDRDPARYAGDSQWSFSQVWLGPDKPEVRAGASAALARLAGGAPPQSVGQPVALPAQWTGASGFDVASAFGDEFAHELEGVPQGRWAGPIGSGLGLHLVKVTAHAPPAKPALAAVRQRVENDWRAERIAKAEDAAYRKLLAGYDVVIEKPKG